jgi:hypothetical protein
MKSHVALKCSSVAFGNPDNLVINPQSLCEKIHPTYQTFGTVTNPAAVTMSMGLPAIAQLSWFLHRHLDNFIVTWKSCPLTGTLQKHMPTLTQTATPHTTGPSECLKTYPVCS